jgi:DNA adenine methylase
MSRRLGSSGGGGKGNGDGLVKPRIKKPFPWYGGKGFLVKRLLELIPSHTTYVEVFGGSAALLFAKEPSKVEIYNDVDSDLVNFFRVLRDPKKYKRMARLASLTPYSREEFYNAVNGLKLGSFEDDVERAFWFWYVSRLCFSGGGRASASLSTSITSYERGMSSTTHKYLNTIKALPWFHQRVTRVQIENQNFETILSRCDRPNTFFYLDPPHLPSSRTKTRYRFDMTEEEHIRLLTTLRAVEGKVLLSGYPSKLYKEFLSDWYSSESDAVCWSVGTTVGTGRASSGGRATDKRTEVLWCNYK